MKANLFPPKVSYCNFHQYVTYYHFIRTRVLITELTAVFTKRINDDEVTSGSKAVIDIASGFALFLRVTNGGPLPNVSIPLQSILNQEQFRRFINNKNNGTAATNDPLLYASLLSSVLQLPPLVRCEVV